MGNDLVAKHQEKIVQKDVIQKQLINHHSLLNVLWNVGTIIKNASNHFSRDDDIIVFEATFDDDEEIKDDAEV